MGGGRTQIISPFKLLVVFVAGTTMSICWAIVMSRVRESYVTRHFWKP